VVASKVEGTGDDFPEPFDRLILLATQLLKAPLAAVTFCDEAGNLVDGNVGLVPPPSDAERVIRPLCGEVIRSGKPLVIPDITVTPSYARHPEVARTGIRAYAGMPLRVGRGPVQGSFSVLDLEPRSWTCQQLGILEGLAAAVESEMELRLRTHRAVTGWSAAERARAGLQFLAEASGKLAESLDLDVTLQRVVRLMVPRLADWCAVHLQQDDGRLARLVLHSQAPGLQPVADDLGDYSAYPSGHPVGPAAVVRTGTTEVVDPVSDEWLRQLALDACHLALLRKTGWQTAIVAPLTVGGRRFGALSCARVAGSPRYEAEDVRVVEQLANRVAVAVDNARLYRERDHVAETLQRSLLPPAFPQVVGLEHGLVYRPAQAGRLVCGDFYDLFQIGARDWVAAIGDVCGKGLQAAALTGLARHVIRTAAMQRTGPAVSPAQILRVLNEALLREDTVPEDARFCTAVCLHVRPRVRDAAIVTAACGGHPRPLVLRRDGTVITMACTGLLLGVFPEVDVGDVRVALYPGDAVVLFTDGATEARREGKLFKTGRLRDLVATCRGLPAQAIADTLARAVVHWGNGDLHDDLAIFVLRNPL